MKLTRQIMNAFEQGAYGGQRDDIDAGVQAVLDLLDPIPTDVDKLHDRDRTCWRRSIDDAAVWTTAGRSRVAIGRTLLDIYGPLQWIDKDGKVDFLMKMEQS